MYLYFIDKLSFIDDVALIIKEAFNPSAIGAGGIIGVLMIGFKELLFPMRLVQALTNSTLCRKN